MQWNAIATTDKFAMDYDDAADAAAAVEHNAFCYSCVLPLKKFAQSFSHQIYIFRKVWMNRRIIWF